MIITKKIFGTINNQTQVHSFILENDNKMSVEILEFGALVVSIIVSDKNGIIDDVVLGYDNLQDYIKDHTYFGATVGRVANRMGDASFTIEGKKYEVAPNTLPDFGKNHIHGGRSGFNKAIWKGKEYKNRDEIGVVLSYTSKDGEEGYPGNLICQVKYSLNNNNELGINFLATTDKVTLANFTHHSYFNLKGAGVGNILDHQIIINADTHTPLSDDLIPTGKIEEVSGALDFKELRSIGSQFDNMQMTKFKGYDLNYIINHSKSGEPDFAGEAIDLLSGRVLKVFTTQPCMHFYTGNFLKGEKGKSGKTYEQNGAFCFEPQGYPDAPHHDNFASIVLKPNEEYTQKIVYKFSVQ